VLRLFLVVFFAIYGLLHLYAFLKAKQALYFGAGKGLLILIFLTLMTLSPVIVHQSERAGLELFARGMSYAGFLWMGVMFIFVSVSFVIDIYRLLVWAVCMIVSNTLSVISPSARGSFFIAAILAIAVNTYGYYEARDIRTEHLTIRSSKIPPQMSPLKVVQISDVHLGLIVRKARLKKIIEAVLKAQPDILVSTGDLVDGEINRLEGLAEILQQVQPKYGKYAVTGNHEYYAGLEQAMNFTERAGFLLLRGSSVDIAGIINLAGVDDPAGKRFGKFNDIKEQKLLLNLDREKFTILLKHRPLFDKDATGLFDLQLSGHTHKGQIFPFVLLTRLHYPLYNGLMDIGDDSYLYVSRGTGTWGPPVRFLAPPEVTVIELIHED